MSHKRLDEALSPVIGNAVARKKAINQGFMTLTHPQRYHLPSVSQLRKTLRQAGIQPNVIERFFTTGV